MAAAELSAPQSPCRQASRPIGPNPEYTGRFVFTRIMYGSARGFGRFGRGGSTWSHDYPCGDRNLTTILSELTTIWTETPRTNVLELSDPEIFRSPILYVSEPGYWPASDEDLRNLREYVLKGGFLIFDDFEENQILNLEANLKRALPEYEMIEIGIDHPIFHSFFDMEDIYFPHPLVDVTPRYLALFEENDPARRMLAIINHNNDIAEYWEWSSTGFLPIDITNEAYKLGVNYMVYGLVR